VRSKAIWTQIKPPARRKPGERQSKAPWFKAKNPPQVARKGFSRQRRPVARVSKRQRRINEIYRHESRDHLQQNPQCQLCAVRGIYPPRPADHIHHFRGKVGSLYTDRRGFRSADFECHRFAHDNIEEARKLGLIAPRGLWGVSYDKRSADEDLRGVEI
jgi:5-methylcytosine-specific restriction endonuclease McrA